LEGDFVEGDGRGIYRRKAETASRTAAMTRS